MAFVTGSAGDLGALRTALINACTANGWAINGEVLSKGTAFLRLQIAGSFINVLGGTGIDAGNLLTGAAPDTARIGAFPVSPLTFPLTYEIHIHTAPDEVYCIVNYNVTDYQWIAFGTSDVQGLLGTGMWFGATLGMSSSTIIIISADDSTSISLTNKASPALFSHSWTQRNAAVHHGIDGLDWTISGDVDGVFMRWNRSIFPLYSRGPNADGDTPLLPLRAYLRRTSFRSSLIVDCAHARLVRIDNLEPRDVITLGPDQWRVYPWFRKSLIDPNGGTDITHTGTTGWAIRFDAAP